MLELTELGCCQAIARSGLGTQNVRSGTAQGGHANDQAVAQIGGSRVLVVAIDRDTASQILEGTSDLIE